MDVKIENISVRFEGANNLYDLVKEYIIYELNIESNDYYTLDKSSESDYDNNNLG